MNAADISDDLVGAAREAVAARYTAKGRTLDVDFQNTLALAELAGWIEGVHPEIIPEFVGFCRRRIAKSASTAEGGDGSTGKGRPVTLQGATVAGREVAI